MVRTLADIFSAFGYTLSLPERMVRSLAAALGGASKLLTDLAVPEPLRRSSTYTAIVGNTQRFVIEKVAEVQGAYAQEEGAGLPDDYVPRKVAGNVMEAAGLLSVHLSPLWVFAFVTDIAKGSKTYLNRLVDELKANNVISPDASVKEVDDLLDALGSAGRNSARVFDAPPIDVNQLKQLRTDLTAGYTTVFKEATDLLPRMDTLWEKMESLARRDNVSLDSIVGLMTVDLSKTAGKAIDAAFAVGSTTADLLGETVFQSYGETIHRIQQQGAVNCLEEASRPFVAAITQHMSASKKTWTEWALGKLTGPFFGGSDAAGDSAGQAPTADSAQAGDDRSASGHAAGE